MTIHASAPGPLEPCVTPDTPATSAAMPSTLIVIVIVGVWLILVRHGVPLDAATTSLGVVAGLGLRVAAGLTDSAYRRRPS